jgi:hypothetical protein
METFWNERCGENVRMRVSVRFQKGVNRVYFVQVEGWKKNQERADGWRVIEC